MAKDKGDKSPSHDDIIEALALELGVDTKSGSKKAVPAKKAEPPKLPKAPKKAKKKKVERVTEVELEVDDDMVVEEGPDPASTTPAEPEEAISSEELEPADFHQLVADDDEEVIDTLFSGSGKETDAYVDDYYGSDVDLHEDIKLNSGVANSLMKIGLVILVTFAGLGAAYFAIPEEYHQDIVPLLSCEDIQTQRRDRRAREEAERRRIWLESRPKYGSLTILTTPGFSRVVVDGQPLHVQHPNREDWLVETRSGTVFADLDIRNHFVVNVTLPNYQTRRIELYPWGQENSIWQQRVDDGSYYLEMNELLQPEQLTAPELMARMTPTATTPDLMGTITVRTNPEGAQIFYNNRLVTGEDGQPILTPASFSSYPAPPPAVPLPGTVEAPPGDAPGPGTSPSDAPPEQLPVTLRATGVPLRVELEGYMPLATGVYRHMFLCEPKPEEIAPEAPFWEHCNYTYDAGLIQLITPEEFAPPEEGTGEGTGEGAGPSGPPSP